MNKAANLPVISVFGSHAPKSGTPLYELARELGSELAKAGFAVATGGYEGTMAAVSQGVVENGGHAIGVTSTVVEGSRRVSLNRWVKEEIRYHSLIDRLIHLVRENDGMVVVEGGIGTLSELALGWSLLQVNEITPRPLVLLGEIWEDTVPRFIQSDYVSAETAALVKIADSPAEAVEYLLANPSSTEI